MSDFTHFDDKGRPRMVDVGAKEVTLREAVAAGRVVMAPETLELVRSGGGKKGDVLTVARLAGIMGAKRTADLIPLCHPIGLDAVELELATAEDPPRVEITARVRVHGRTGVEMEALTAVAVAALTVYDMCKAVDRAISIENVHLVEKSGGRSGQFKAPP
jgi:cyclic pyranopterin phosphate synthase